MVAEVRQAADADPTRHVGGGPAREDRDRDPARRCLGGAGQATERPPGERHDGRGTRVARALGQRPVEVGDDQKAALASGERRDRPDGRRSACPSGRQLVTWTPGMIFSRALFM
jgi:hypothetical protein